MPTHFRRFRADPYRPGSGPLVQPWIQPLRHNLLTFRRYWTLVSLLTFSLLIGLSTFSIQNRWRDLGITAAAMAGYGVTAFLFDLADRYTEGSAWQQGLRALRKFGVVLGLTAVHWFLPAASTELWLLYLIPMITIGVDLDRLWARLLILFTIFLMFLSAWPMPAPNVLFTDWQVYARNGAIRAVIGGYIGLTNYLLARALAYQTNTIREGLTNLFSATVADRWLNAADTVAGVIANLLSDAKRHVTMNVLVYEAANQTIRLIGSSTSAGQQSARSGFSFDVSRGITGWAAQQGVPCFINDTSNDPEQRFLAATAFPDTRSALAVPVKLDHKRSVVLELESSLPYDVAYEDLQLMNHVGHYLLTAHQRHVMLEFHQRLVQLGTALADRIIHVKEIGAMLQEIGAVALDLLDADLIRFYYRNPDSGQIDQRCTIGALAYPAIEELPMDQTHTIITPLMEAARLQLFADVRNEPQFIRKSAWHEQHRVEPFVSREGIIACAAMPLVVGQEKLGLMWVNYRQPQEFSSALQSSIQLLAPYAALAIKSSIQSALSERNRRVTMRRIVHDSLAHRLHDVVRGLERLDRCPPESTAWKEERMIVQCQVERARRVVDNLIGERHWVTLQSVIDDLETQAQLLGKYYQMAVKTMLCKAAHTPISIAGGNELMFACDEINRFLDEHAPDVALVDLGLMRAKGSLHVTQEQDFEEALWIITRINEHSPYTKIMGFSNYFITEPALAKQALDHGAHAIIAKQNGPAEWQAWIQWLCSQLHAVLNNWWRMSPEVARLLQDQEEERQRTQPNAPLPLTKRQMEVLHCLASGLSDEKIAQKLCIEPGAVRGHISNIRERLQLRYRWQIIDEARRRGIGEQPAADKKHKHF